jgi:hypothetical protein
MSEQQKLKNQKRQRIKQIIEKQINAKKMVQEVRIYKTIKELEF